MPMNHQPWTWFFRIILIYCFCNISIPFKTKSGFISFFKIFVKFFFIIREPYSFFFCNFSILFSYSILLPAPFFVAVIRDASTFLSPPSMLPCSSANDNLLKWGVPSMICFACFLIFKMFEFVSLFFTWSFLSDLEFLTHSLFKSPFLSKCCSCWFLFLSIDFSNSSSLQFK